MLITNSPYSSHHKEQLNQVMWWSLDDKIGALPASSSPGLCVYYTWCADKILSPGPCQTRRQIHKDTWLIVSVKREILNVAVSFVCVVV